MKFTLTRDAQEFAERTRGLLERHIECNLSATVLAGVRAGRYPGTVPLFAYGVSHGDVRFAALRTPPWHMVATELGAEHALEFMRAWLGEDPSLAGVNAPTGAARALAMAWTELTGGEACCQVRELGYVLERVVDPPRPAPGALRLVRVEERPLALSWMKAFAREARDLPPDRAEVIVNARMADSVDVRMPGAGLWLWDDDGPVSILATSPRVAGTVRIGPVYTPPAQRRRGYAGTAVAEASRQALAQGAERCMLFTDAANPTSNKIYMEVGYRQYGEHEEWVFRRRA